MGGVRLMSNFRLLGCFFLVYFGGGCSCCCSCCSCDRGKTKSTPSPRLWTLDWSLTIVIGIIVDQGVATSES